MQNVPATMAQVMKVLDGKADHVSIKDGHGLEDIQAMHGCSLPVVQVCHARCHIMGSQKELQHLQAAIDCEPTVSCCILSIQQTSVAVWSSRGACLTIVPANSENTCASIHAHHPVTHMEGPLAAELQQKPGFHITDVPLNSSGSKACLRSFESCQKLSRSPALI